MTRTTGVEPRKPPPRFLMRAMNVVPRIVLRSPLHGLMSGNVLLLAFDGRKSGRRYVTPMSYARAGEIVLMSTEAPWWKNLADGGADVEMRLRGREVAGFAEAVTDEEAVVEGIGEIVRLYPGYGRFVGVGLDEEGSPDREAVVRAARRGRVLIRARLDGAA
ncbi:DUF385 domain-containing protein [Rubrobacter marinus]|uniref:DUF385 domain-containing protein n=1 Tax=Rubrobacter marinus TaxID=2653852 RepID=A0A6G8PZV0_9ACTN|nr:nitroreductase/quinone reductase family protein [Rubrobacter marinus]QIN79710.1 DUF385 domain-containing protein [Rubrobacter marinus]